MSPSGEIASGDCASIFVRVRESVVVTVCASAAAAALPAASGHGGACSSVAPLARMSECATSTSSWG